MNTGFFMFRIFPSTDQIGEYSVACPFFHSFPGFNPHIVRFWPRNSFFSLFYYKFIKVRPYLIILAVIKQQVSILTGMPLNFMCRSTCRILQNDLVHIHIQYYHALGSKVFIKRKASISFVYFRNFMVTFISGALFQNS